MGIRLQASPLSRTMLVPSSRWISAMSSRYNIKAHVMIFCAPLANSFLCRQRMELGSCVCQILLHVLYLTLYIVDMYSFLSIVLATIALLWMDFLIPILLGCCQHYRSCGYIHVGVCTTCMQCSVVRCLLDC